MFKELTRSMKLELRKKFVNLDFCGIKVNFGDDYDDDDDDNCNERAIRFTNQSTHQNWLYYAGFEYIKDYDITRKSREDIFEATYYAEDSGRVSDVIDLLEEFRVKEEMSSNLTSEG